MTETASAPRRSRARARGVALLLVAYGVVGLVLMVGTALAVGRPLDEISTLTASLESQRSALIRSMDSTSAAVGEAATSTGDFRASLDRARTSATTAADLSRNVSATMGQIALTMQVQVFGTQPFISLADPFNRAGGQLTDLGTQLDGVSGALASNRDSVTRIGDRLTDLSTRVTELTTSVRDGPRIEVSASAIGTVRLIVYAILAWLALLAAGCVLAGAALLTRLR